MYYGDDKIKKGNVMENDQRQGEGIFYIGYLGKVVCEELIFIYQELNLRCYMVDEVKM